MPLTGASVIEGRVLTASGQPVVEARVVLADAPVAVPDVALLTDDQGRFAIGAPAPGRYVVMAYAEGHESASAEVDVVAGAPRAAVELVMATA